MSLNDAVSLSRQGRFQEALELFLENKINRTDDEQYKFHYIRSSIEVGADSQIDSCGNKYYDSLITAIKDRKNKKYKDAYINIINNYNNLYIPDGDRELSQIIFEYQMLSLSNDKIDKTKKIPKFLCKITQFWDSGTIPGDVAELIATWRASGLRHELFNNNSAGHYIMENYGRFAFRAYEKCYHPAMKADLFRLAYLANEGGFYVDADEALVGDINEYIVSLNMSENQLICSYAPERVANNNFLIAPPRHPIIMKALMLSIENIYLHSEYPIWAATGPGVLGRSIAWCAECLDLDAMLGVIRLDRSMWDGYLTKKEDLQYKSDDRNWNKVLISAEN